jgi:hypothetical protein
MLTNLIYIICMMKITIRQLTKATSGFCSNIIRSTAPFAHLPKWPLCSSLKLCGVAGIFYYLE